MDSHNEQPRAPQRAIAWRWSTPVGATLTVVGVALAAAATLTDKLKAPRWIWIALVIAGPVLVGLGKWLELAAARQATLALLVTYPPPRIQEVDPYHLLNLNEPPPHMASSTAANRSTTERFPYVPRPQHDKELRAALSKHQAVVLVGESKAGKTRTAWEAIRALWPERRLLVLPRDDPDSLPALLDLLPSLLRGRHPSVIWLDDLERYLGPKAITIRRLQEWTRRQLDLRVVATMTNRAWASIAEVDTAVRDPRRDTLARFTPVELPLLPDADEHAEFTQRYPDQQLAGGFGEHFVAAQELRAKYSQGHTKCSFEPTGATCPVGRALVQVAVDWRRIGLAHRPLPEADLLILYPTYAQIQRPGVTISEEHYSGALGWATTPIASHVALLSCTDAGQGRLVEVNDYIAEDLTVQAAKAAQAVPDQTWRHAVATRENADDLFLIGVARYRARSASGPTDQTDDLVVQAFQKAATSGHHDAENNLGWLLDEQGRTKEAEEWYRKGRHRRPPRGREQP